MHCFCLCLRGLMGKPLLYRILCMVLSSLEKAVLSRS
jgi:hypothetical protein